MNDLTPGRTDKFRAYRARKKAAGLREIRMWVPDLSDPVLRERIRREGEALRGRPEEEEALDFIEAAMRDVDERGD